MRHWTGHRVDGEGVRLSRGGYMVDKGTDAQKGEEMERGVKGGNGATDRQGAEHKMVSRLTMTEESRETAEGRKDGKEAGEEKTKDDKEDKKDSAKVVLKKLPYMGITKPLGAHLMASSKERIWKGEYVEMLKLLHRELRSKEGSKEEKYELARHPRCPR